MACCSQQAALLVYIVDCVHILPSHAHQLLILTEQRESLSGKDVFAHCNLDVKILGMFCLEAVPIQVNLFAYVCRSISSHTRSGGALPFSDMTQWAKPPPDAKRLAVSYLLEPARILAALHIHPGVLGKPPDSACVEVDFLCGYIFPEISAKKFK